MDNKLISDIPIMGIHHVAIVVHDIKKASLDYVESFGYKIESEIKLESNQKVFVQFITLGNYRIELLQPSCDESPVTNFLNKGGLIYHNCYETNNLDKAINHMKDTYNAILTYGPSVSLSMEKCDYAFLAKPTGEVIELVCFK